MQNNNQNLLSVLKNLISQLNRLSFDITRIRLLSYRKIFNSQIKIDMTSVLNKQVEELAARAVIQQIDFVEINENTGQLTTVIEQHTRIEYNNEAKLENVTGVESEFAKYLRQKKFSSVTQPHLGDALKASAWEHIHCAIRHARKGELDTAKVHTAIAGTALEEAGQFMNHKDYSELVCEIEVYFAEPLK